MLKKLLIVGVLLCAENAWANDDVLGGLFGDNTEQPPKVNPLQIQEAASQSPAGKQLVDLGDQLSNFDITTSSKPNYAKAAEYYQKAVDLDDPVAMTRLAALYRDGQGVNKNNDKATELYQKAAGLGDPRAKMILGSTYSYEGFKYFKQNTLNSDAKAFSLFLKSAELDFAGGESMVGQMYMDGRGVPVNYAKAAEWLQKATDQIDIFGVMENADTPLRLATLYHLGYGVQQDEQKAVSLYQLAIALDNNIAAQVRQSAIQGDKLAKTELNFMYHDGLIDQNSQITQTSANNSFMAIKELHSSAIQGDVKSQLTLGVVYQLGKGVKQDYSQSVEWFTRAASSTNIETQLSSKDKVMLFAALAHSHVLGRGVQQDDAKAEKYYLSYAEAVATDLGNQIGQDNYVHAKVRALRDSYLSIANMYAKGSDQIPRNDGRADTWFIKAAHTGDIDIFQPFPNGGQTAEDVKKEAIKLDLGDIYFSAGQDFAAGKKVQQNDTLAAKWYQKSVEQEYGAAELALGDMYAKGQGVQQNDATAIELYQKAAKQYTTASLATARLQAMGKLP